MSPHVVHSSSFIEDAAQLIIGKITEAIGERGRCVISLCGGTTPGPVYAEIARRGKEINWEKVFITFGDERVVAPTHAESNYRMAKEILFDRISLPPANILRMRGELPPEKAALEYEKDLRKLLEEGTMLIHDVMLLGMGGDGHTASLFPGTRAVSETDRWVKENFVPSLDTWRITCTYPLINSSRIVCFLINDPRKKEIAERILAGDQTYPAANARGREQTIWLLGF